MSLSHAVFTRDVSLSRVYQCLCGLKMEHIEPCKLLNYTTWLDCTWLHLNWLRFTSLYFISLYLTHLLLLVKQQLIRSTWTINRKLEYLFIYSFNTTFCIYLFISRFIRITCDLLLGQKLFSLDFDSCFHIFYTFTYRSISPEHLWSKTTWLYTLSAEIPKL